MNKDTAKDYLPLVQALAEGKTIEYRDSDDAWIDCESPTFNQHSAWIDCESPTFNQHSSRYRIKPEPKKDWARLALLKDDKEYFSGRADKDMGESEDEMIKGLEALYCARFISWLTDRIEYTLPEGDA